VISIIESGQQGIITALVSNVREFKRAAEQANRLTVCEEELKVVREEIADLRRQVDRLAAPLHGADQSGAA